MTMYQWVDASSSRLLKRNSAQVTQDKLLELEYTSKEALAIAFKLTDLFIEAEKEELMDELIPSHSRVLFQNMYSS